MTYVEPVIPCLLVVLLLGAFLVRRRPRLARGAVLLGAGGLLLWSWYPTVKLTSATLEFPYSSEAVPNGDAEAIVVLAASVLPPTPPQAEAVARFSTYLRTRHAAWLYHNWKALPVLATGGPIGKPPLQAIAAETMRHVLLGEGVPPELAWAETRSLSTYQNALYSARILRARGISRIALVTDGYHMLRAERCFRQQGFEVLPAPCSFRSRRPLNNWRGFVPTAKAMIQNEDCLHEWVGLLYYWLTGKI